MIGYIKGKVMYASEGTVLLENNGVGYEIVCSGAAYAKMLGAAEGEAYTYLQVREDGLSLFGFESPEEKNMFLKLISVSGVGPKMGITVLSSMNINDIAVAIATSDVKMLTAVKGLGKKMIRLAIRQYGAFYVDVNEQNEMAEGFYRHMGFRTFRRDETDEQGNPFPILHMQRPCKG